MSQPRRGLLAALFSLGAVALVGAQMPDVAQMSGTPLPASDLPDGTVSVRVVRGDLSNNAPDVQVTLHDGQRTLAARTDATGRASFTGIAAGASVHAHATVDGRELQSATFTMPTSGGVRILLVAPADGGGAAQPGAGPAAPPAPGAIVLGGQSRLLVEITDDGLDVYLLFDIANTAAQAAAIEPIEIGVPERAQALTVLETSSPLVTAEGRRFVVRGPLPPGVTPIQVAYRLPIASGALTVLQPLPLPMPTPSILVRRIAGVEFQSPQATSLREVTMQDGTPYLLATGQALDAGSRLELRFAGLPHHSTLPRLIALGLAMAILGAGVWLAVQAPGADPGRERAALEARRAHLLDQLVAVERRRLAGDGADPGITRRRAELLAQLERIYAQIDAVAAEGGGPGNGAAEVLASAGAAGARAVH